VSDQLFDTPQNQEFVQSIPVVVTEAKAGYRTTEFWVTIALSLLTVLDGVPLPEKYEGFVLALLGVAYTFSRGIAKNGVPAPLDA
jgi:hypothetical protein